MTMNASKWNALSEQARAALLQRPAVRNDDDIRADVEAILAAVRGAGDTALRELTQKFDGTSLKDLRVSDDELARATADLNDKARSIRPCPMIVYVRSDKPLVANSSAISLKRTFWPLRMYSFSPVRNARRLISISE